MSTFTDNNITYQIITTAIETQFIVSVIGFSGTGTLTIPSTVPYNSRNYYVYQIGDGLQAITTISSTSLTAVNIPTTVSIINNNAFSGSTNLTTVTFTTLIGGTALMTINSSAFSNCGLTSVTLPANLTVIGDGAFSNNSSLATVNFLGGKPTGGTGAIVTGSPSGFYTYKARDWGVTTSYRGVNLTQESNIVTVNNFIYALDVPILGEATVNSYVGTNTNILISESIFYNNPYKVTVIGDGTNSLTFSTSSTISSVFFNFSSVIFGTQISANAFKNTTLLTNISFAEPSSITSIGSNAFDGSNLSNVTIPSSVTTIGDAAFSNNTNLANVNFLGSKPGGGTGAIVTTTPNGTYPYVDVGNTWLGASPYRGIAMTQTPQTTTVGGFLYNLASPLSYQATAVSYTQAGSGSSTLTIPAFAPYSGTNYSVEVIGNGTAPLYDGSSTPYDEITEVNLPFNTTTISNSAFIDCESLTRVPMPSRTKTIGNNAFKNCINLGSIEIAPTALGIIFSRNSSITTIGDNAFDNSGLIDITIPRTVTSIGNGAFNNNPDLQSIAFLGDKPTTGGSADIVSSLVPGTYTSGRTSWNNTTLYRGLSMSQVPTQIGTGMYILNNSNNEATYVAYVAFDDSPLDLDLFIPARVTFEGTTYSVVQVGNGDDYINETEDIRFVSIPTSVRTISSYVFPNESLTSITFREPSSLTTIEGFSFTGCGLTSLNIPSSVISIGESAFNAIFNLSSLTFNEPSSLTTIGINCFKEASITSVTIPASVSSIGDNAFSQSFLLKNFIFLGNKPTGGTDTIVDPANNASGTYPPGNFTWASTKYYRGITLPQTQTPTAFVDLSIFQLPTCPSSIVVDKVEGKVMTASISPFFKDLYYAFYVDGVKVLDNIQTPTFQYVFTIPGIRNVYITSSTVSTVNRFQQNIPKNVVTIFVF